MLRRKTQFHCICNDATLLWGMAKAKKIEFEGPAHILGDDEDESTLAAIDNGIRDAEAGRVVPAEEVRKLLPTWITASSTRNP